MKKTIFALFALLLVALNSCFLGWGEYNKRVKDSREGWERKREESRNITFEEARRQRELYNAMDAGICHADRIFLDKISQFLEEGYDPNRSDGEDWSDKTPLHVLATSFFDSWAWKWLNQEIPDPPPDIEVFNLLVDAGADVNQWPYIWCRVYQYDNRILDQMIRNAGYTHTGTVTVKREDSERRQELALYHFVNDANRVIEAFLKAGADPDMLGHPYPYSLEAKRRWISDEEAREWFAKGTRPINEAIKKGIRWESQVDLLLQYTTLDEDSLKAAKKSKDRAMIEKITKLWNEQNAVK